MTAKEIKTTAAAMRLKDAFAECEESGKVLNEASDKLAELFKALDARIAGMNLGVAAWYTYAESKSPTGWNRSVGYTRSNKRWGLSIKQWRDEPTGDHLEEVWLINDAPRFLRIEAAAHIPDLIESLAKRTKEMTKLVERAEDTVNTLLAVLPQPESGTK